MTIYATWEKVTQKIQVHELWKCNFKEISFLVI